MEPGRRAFVDLTSRILSIVSLLVAIAAVGYLYVQHSATDNSDEMMTAFSKQLANEAREYADARTVMEREYQTALDRQDARMEQWNTQLNESLGAFRLDAQSLLTEIQKSDADAMEVRQLAFDAALNRIADVAVTDQPSDNPSLKGPGNSEDPADSPPSLAAAETASTAKVASLRVVNTVLRPGTGNTTLIVVENNGEQDAAINRIRFRPQGEFETTDNFELSASETANVTTIAYQAADNTSEKPGYHGIYDRQLTQPLKIPAGQSLTIRVTIDDDQYEGWGFTGKLVVDYNAAEPLTVESARVAFRPET